MKNVEQIKAIENYNKEYINLYHSKIARMKRNLNRLRKSNPKDAIRLTRKKILTKIGNIRIKKNIIFRNSESSYYISGRPIEDTKVAVYTCITNGYDSAKDPVYIENDTDYYLYTDERYENKKSVWKSQKLMCNGFECEANRYYKFHPDIFNNNYDYAVYIDGNVRIISDVTTICSIAHNSKIGIAMHKHHSRDCAYEEGKACKYYKRGNLEKIQNQLKIMENEGFPKRFGLCEATIIVYDLKNPNVEKIAHQWWDMYIKSETKRDQIFFPYIIWKMGLKIDDVGDLGNNIWKNPKFILYGHD